MTILAKFEAGRDPGTVIALVDGKVSFPDRSGVQPKVGETWEVQIKGENPTGKVNFLRLIQKVELTEWTWNDGIGSRTRHPACLIVTASGDVHRFKGVSIPGIVQLLKSKYEKKGKWSNTTFHCVSPAGTKIYAWRQSWEEGLYWPQGSWEEAIRTVQQEAPQLKAASLEAIIRLEWPQAAQKFDENRNALILMSGVYTPPEADVPSAVADETEEVDPQIASLLEEIARDWHWVASVTPVGAFLLITMHDMKQYSIKVSAVTNL